MTEYKPFKDLTREEKLDIFEAALDGELEMLSGGVWLNVEYVHGCVYFYDNDVYRRKSYQLDIPWDYIEKEFNYAAMNAFGDVWVFKEEPRDEGDFWESYSNMAYIPLKDKPDISKWKETLTKRPEGV